MARRLGNSLRQSLIGILTFSATVSAQDRGNAPGGAKDSGDPADPRGVTDGDSKAETTKLKKLEVSRMLRRAVATGGPMYLLENSVMQKELEITKGQMTRIQEINSLYLSEARALNEMVSSQAIANPDAIDQRAVADQRKLGNRDLVKSLESVLHKNQRTRLHQMLLQAKGPILAMTNPEVMSELKLTLDQRKERDRIIKRMEAEQFKHLKTRNDLIESGSSMFGSEARDLLSKADLVEADASREILKLLTAKQADTYRRLIGEEFDFTDFSKVNAPKSPTR